MSAGWVIGRIRASDQPGTPREPVIGAPDHSQVGFNASALADPTNIPDPFQPPAELSQNSAAAALMTLAGEQYLLGLWYFGKKIDGT